MVHKRRLSASGNPERDAKRVHQVPDEEDESLEVILARIKEQEESERLAKQLHEQWNGSSIRHTSNTEHSGASVDDAILIDDNSVNYDEALARHLAEEWNEEDDDVVIVGTSTASSSSLQSQTQSRSSPIGVTPSSSQIIHRAPSIDTETSLDLDLAHYRDVFVRSRKCTKCGSDVESPRGYVTYSKEVPPPSLLYLLHAVCKSCKTNHCRGCFSVIPCPPSCKGRTKDKVTHCPVVTCCVEVRAIALFEALGGFDRLYLGEQATSNARAAEAVAKQKKGTKTIGPGGTGYGMGNRYNNGTGRGRGRFATKQAPNTRRNAMAAHWDELLVRALTTVTMFLPSPYSDSEKEYDILPHPSISALLSLSQLPELLGSLLRNDSLTDWIARSDVYQTMLALLRRMADCELTMQALVSPRHELRSSCGLEEWMWQGGEIIWEKSDDKLVKIPPLYTHFQKLTKQSETFLSGASHMLEQDIGDNEDSETMVKTTSLCGDIIAARDNIERAMAVMGKDPANLVPAEEPSLTDRKGKGVDPKIDLERRYAQACERLAFRHVLPPDGSIFRGFHYANEVKETENATRNPKDRLHLIKELAVMATSLPAGIWVRPHEIRNDVIKIMIAGPEGTPYAGGLFEFDCFIPLQYPHVPPKMNLCTTGGGRVRFNPNLYNCGKVCLSLLGTWDGRPEEMWNPRTSTLLQVLVSIQSMILVELPFFNEPGYGQAKASNAKSIAYNKNITAETTRWAIVDWLKDEHGTGMWADVIQSHFTIRCQQIRKTIEEWVKAEPRILNYSMSPASNHHPMNRYGVPGQVHPQLTSGLNLLALFDRGVDIVSKWKSEDDDR